MKALKKSWSLCRGGIQWTSFGKDRLVQNGFGSLGGSGRVLNSGGAGRGEGPGGVTAPRSAPVAKRELCQCCFSVSA